ncbi:MULTISPECIES: thioesterase II family protein [unclassified Microbispora]|uniref:thioesterase II family protein n=1 Tax=unclassified Microbispora TaxID=2614687 RepID=UPI0016014069|nr:MULTISPECIES: alpha/beta fold hydrolase [unclassified Microbispora]
MNAPLAGARVRGDWLREFAPAAPGAPRLVVFPHAGGSAGFFIPLARALAPQVRVLAVQYPGRLDRRREPPVEDVRELARRVADVLAREPDDGPLAFFGHSMGSLVAFEAALLGERGAGAAPERLFVSGGRAPALTRVDPVILRNDAALLEEALFLGGTSRQVLESADLRELVLPPLRADYRALRSYLPDPGARVRCPVTALVGDRDPRVTVDQAARWRDHTDGGFRLTVLPGGHFYLTPRLEDVAAAVRNGLAVRA